QNSSACRTPSGKDTPARWPAGESCPQGYHHGAQCSRVHSHADPQPLPSRKYHLQHRLRDAFLPDRPSFHQRESHPLTSESFAPSVERILCQPLFLTELLHGHFATLLRGDSVGPLLRFRVGRLFPNNHVAHATTMSSLPRPTEEGFTRRLHNFA